MGFRYSKEGSGLENEKLVTLSLIIPEPGVGVGNHLNGAQTLGRSNAGFIELVGNAQYTCGQP